jgi:hypothetical protein
MTGGGGFPAPLIMLQLCLLRCWCNIDIPLAHLLATWLTRSPKALMSELSLYTHLALQDLANAFPNQVRN